MFEDNIAAKLIRILVRVPIVIAVVFIMLNMFAFATSYFKIVGASNMLQQVVMDKNYLTDADIDAFNRYLGGLKNSYLADIRIVIDTNVEDGTRPRNEANPKDLYDYRAVTNRAYDVYSGAEVSTNDHDISQGTKYTNQRRQYGNLIDVGIVATYKFMNPLNPNQMTVSGKAVQGYNSDGSADTTYLSNSELEEQRKRNTGGGIIHSIKTVVGLHYYSDLE